MKMMYSFALSFFLLACCQPAVNNNTTLNETPSMETPATKTITVEAILETADKIRIVVKNTGNSTIKLVNRMAMCYPDMKDGEIYLIITDKSSGKIVGEGTMDYNRAAARKEDIITLAPGKEISAEYPLSKWYDFPKGELELQAVYSCDNSLDLDPELLKGEYRSEKIAFTNK
jgi:hypothetical protein